MLESVYTDDVVVVSDGTKTVTYTLNIQGMRLPNTVSSLDALSVSAGTLTPAFDPAVLNYSVTLPFGSTGITVTATETDTAATVAGDGVIALTGNTTLNVVVTAEDGVTTTTYAIAVEILSNIAVNNVEAPSFEVYPNPVTNELICKLDANKSGAYVKLVNVIGEVVFEKFEKSPVIRINTESLAKGLYFITVKANNQSVTKKIVKQ